MSETSHTRAAAHTNPTAGEGVRVLTVSALDQRTVLVRGEAEDSEYTMVETYEHHTEVVTVSHADTPIARVELHDIRASKISLGGGALVTLKDWLHRTPVNSHNFPVDGIDGRFEWRSAWHGLRHQLELFAPGGEEPIAFAYKGRHEHEGTPTGDTSKGHQEHEVAPAGDAALDQLAHAVSATLILTPAALVHQDCVVLTYLLIDRRTRPDPLQG